MVYSSNEVRILVTSMSDKDIPHFYTKSTNFRPESIDLSFCDANVYDEAETVVKADQVSLFHFHDQECSSTLEKPLMVLQNIHNIRRSFKLKGIN